jgi:hypothetical protein
MAALPKSQRTRLFIKPPKQPEANAKVNRLKNPVMNKVPFLSRSSVACERVGRGNARFLDEPDIIAAEAVMQEEIGNPRDSRGWTFLGYMEYIACGP